MKRTAFYRWWITSETTGKRIKSSWDMTEEQARARYPGAEPIPGTQTWRDLPETDEERAKETISRPLTPEEIAEAERKRSG